VIYRPAKWKGRKKNAVGMGDFNGRASVENYCFNHPELSTKKPLVFSPTVSKKLISL
jgi:hypothetical protein